MALSSLLLAAAAQTDGAANKTQLLVLPYQPIYRSVPQAKAEKATEFLNRELGKLKNVGVVRAGVARADAEKPSAAAIETASKAAETAEANKDIRGAITARKTLIKTMEKNASALKSAEDFVMAYHYLARALMWAGEDAESKKSIDIAVRMAPELKLPPANFSRLYRHWFRQAAAKAAKDSTGDLLVKSALPGAKITLDGREMDVAPVLLQKTAAGRHLIGAKVDGVSVYRAVVTVRAKTKTEFRASFGGTVGGDAVGIVTEAISVNGLPAAAVKKAVEAGKEVGATYVVAGGMSKEEDHFNVHTFVINVASQKVQTMEPVKFDLDLLTAEADVFRVVSQVEASLKGFAGTGPMIAMIERKARKQSTINEVDARPAFDAARKKRRSAVKTKDGKRRVFKALKGSRVKIKDE